MSGDGSNKKTTGDKIENEDDGDDAIKFNWNEVPDPNEHESTPTTSTKYGKRVNGPWVVGLHLDKNHVRFVEVMARTDETLTNVLQKHEQDGSVIDTDKWSGYNRLEDYGYIHFIVNHSENNFNPGTGYHIQRTERAWVDAKAYMNAFVAILIFYSIT